MPYNLAFLSPPFLPHNSAFISLIWLFYFPNKAGNTAEWISSSFAQFVKLRCSLSSLCLCLCLSPLSRLPTAFLWSFFYFVGFWDTWLSALSCPPSHSPPTLSPLPVTISLAPFAFFKCFLLFFFW